jgi:hypothetical protein
MEVAEFGDGLADEGRAEGGEFAAEIGLLAPDGAEGGAQRGPRALLRRERREDEQGQREGRQGEGRRETHGANEVPAGFKAT